MPAVFGARDLRVFFGMGVPVAFNGVSRYLDGAPILGLLDRPLEAKLGDQGGGGVDVYLPELRLPYNAFQPMPTNRDTLVVDGTPFTISDSGGEDDDAIVVYGLKATS